MAIKTKGISLVEIMVVIVIFMVMVTAVYSAIIFNLRYSYQFRLESELQQKALVIIRHLRKHIENSLCASIDNANNTLILYDIQGNQTAYTLSGSTLTYNAEAVSDIVSSITFRDFYDPANTAGVKVLTAEVKTKKLGYDTEVTLAATISCRLYRGVILNENKGIYYDSIQPAIDAASQGDVIKCMGRVTGRFSGVFEECININKPLILRGGYTCGFSDANRDLTLHPTSIGFADINKSRTILINNLSSSQGRETLELDGFNILGGATCIQASNLNNINLIIKRISVDANSGRGRIFGQHFSTALYVESTSDSAINIINNNIKGNAPILLTQCVNTGITVANNKINAQVSLYNMTDQNSPRPEINIYNNILYNDNICKLGSLLKIGTSENRNFNIINNSVEDREIDYCPISFDLGQNMRYCDFTIKNNELKHIFDPNGTLCTYRDGISIANCTDVSADISNNTIDSYQAGYATAIRFIPGNNTTNAPANITAAIERNHIYNTGTAAVLLEGYPVDGGCTYNIRDNFMDHNLTGVDIGNPYVNSNFIIANNKIIINTGRDSFGISCNGGNNPPHNDCNVGILNNTMTCKAPSTGNASVYVAAINLANFVSAPPFDIKNNYIDMSDCNPYVNEGAIGIRFFCNNNTPALLENNLITGCGANTGSRSALCSTGLVNSDITISNCTVTHNNKTGIDLNSNADSDIDIINCIIWANTNQLSLGSALGNKNLSYSCIQGGYSGTPPGIEINNNDPLFTDVNSSDYTLMYDPIDITKRSPCVDTGHPYLAAGDGIYLDPAEPDDPGDFTNPLNPDYGTAALPAKNTRRNDMGAYGGLGVISGIGCNHTGLAIGHDHTNLTDDTNTQYIREDIIGPI